MLDSDICLMLSKNSSSINNDDKVFPIEESSPASKSDPPPPIFKLVLILGCFRTEIKIVIRMLFQTVKGK